MALSKSTQEKNEINYGHTQLECISRGVGALEHYLSNLHSNGSRKNYLCPILANLKLFQKEKK